MTTTTPVDLHVRQLDPRTLLLDRNVRREPALDPDFVASVKEFGVLVPIVAVQAPDGVRVRHGERRTRAAVEAGRDTVPVVVTGPDSDDKAAEIERLLTQWAENEHRAGLDDGDKLAAFEQLTAFGLSPAAIARRTRAPRVQVNAALAVARSDLARQAHDRYDFLDLVRAAVVAEFDDDPDAVKALVLAARTGGFDHVAQRCRDDRTERDGRERAAADLAERGVRVVDRPGAAGPARCLNRLDHDGTPLTPDSHSSCPGHAAYVLGGYAQPGTDGAEDGSTGAYQRVFRPEYVCTDPDTHGHVDRYRPAPSTGTGTGAGGGGGGGGAGPAGGTGPLSDTAKAERREVIENNKAWRSATTVRRDWLRVFLARKTPPKGAGRFVARLLVAGDHELRRAFERHHPTGRALLGAKDAPLTEELLAEVVDQATEQRAQVVTLALVLGAYEDALDAPAWRYPSPSARRYLTALQTWGYDLADVERLVTTPPDASDAQPAEAAELDEQAPARLVRPDDNESAVTDG